MTRAKQREPVKVAVLGGGMGALAAAWELIRLDPRGYEITVYQRGWRLGGKGASGRNRQPGKGLRIEEHGLHILMGFYDHVFHILKTCYDDLGPYPADCRNGGIGTWREALSGSDHLHVYDRYRDGHCKIWELNLPRHSEEVPGTRPPEEPDIGEWLRNGLVFIYELIQNSDVAPGDAPAHPARATGDVSARRWLERLARTLVRCESHSVLPRWDLLSEMTRTSVRWALAYLFRRLGDPERRDVATIARRRQAMTAYFVGANLLGIISNGLWCKQDFLRFAEGLDHLDYRQWLHLSGGSIGESWPELTWDSALVNAVYDLIFSHGSGFGAGTALYDTLCMLLSYRSQLYYRMNGGMGDVVFTPLYLWLRRHGVRFRFFHRVWKLELEASAGRSEISPRRRIERISVEEQVDVRGDEYDPLFEARGRACWPSAPLYERLPCGERRRLERGVYDLENDAEPGGPIRQLRRGRDFELAVLAIPVGVFQHERKLIGELAAAHPPLSEMIQGLQTIRTRALQIWTDGDATALGWSGKPGMMGAYRRPFASWADMSQVLVHEAWEPAQAVSGVHYFCGVDEPGAEDSGEPASTEQDAHERVRREAIDWLQASMPGLLPGWSWDRTSAPDGRGPERFAAQYWRANASPSERYVLSAPGTLRFRLASDQSGFENLYLAGDWVRTELNAGCLEAAAMAGLAAARAIHGQTRQLLISLPRASAASSERRQRLSTYVDRDSDWVLRAPVRAENVTTALFVLRADPEALAVICAEQIAGPSCGQVTAYPWPASAGLVMLVCSQLPRIESNDDRHGRLGFREQEVGVFVPVAMADGQGGRELGLLAPYLFVDSAIGLSAGREIYGFSKLLARIEMPLALPGHGFAFPPGITVVSDVLARVTGDCPEGNTNRRVEQATVLEVIPAAGSRRPAPSNRAIVGYRSSRRAVWRLLPLLARGLARFDRNRFRGPGLSFSMPFVFLKQFRDAAAPAAACHQSLVQCGAQVNLASLPRRLQGRFLVRLPPYAKPNLAGTLGLPNELEANLALQLKYDLYLPEARQIWP